MDRHHRIAVMRYLFSASGGHIWLLRQRFYRPVARALTGLALAPQYYAEYDIGGKVRFCSILLFRISSFLPLRSKIARVHFRRIYLRLDTALYLAVGLSTVTTATVCWSMTTLRVLCTFSDLNRPRDVHRPDPTQPDPPVDPTRSRGHF